MEVSSGDASFGRIDVVWFEADPYSICHYRFSDHNERHSLPAFWPLTAKGHSTSRMSWYLWVAKGILNSVICTNTHIQPALTISAVYNRTLIWTTFQYFVAFLINENAFESGHISILVWMILIFAGLASRSKLTSSFLCSFCFIKTIFFQISGDFYTRAAMTNCC